MHAARRMFRVCCVQDERFAMRFSRLRDRFLLQVTLHAGDNTHHPRSTMQHVTCNTRCCVRRLKAKLQWRSFYAATNWYPPTAECLSAERSVPFGTCTMEYMQYL
jgi:hypothetical protein